MAPSSNKPRQFNWQTLLIGVGALIVVTLTILAAIFLAGRDITGPSDLSLTETAPTSTPIVITPSATPTVPTATVAVPATPTAPLAPTATFTQSPTPVTPTTTATPSPTPTPICVPREDWVIYVVQPGDTLGSLAARTNTSVGQLRAGNCLTDDRIVVGQQLRLPFIPPTLTPTSRPSPTPSPTAAPPTPTRRPPPPPTPTDTPTVRPTPTKPDVTLGTPTPTTTFSLPTEITGTPLP